MRTARRRSALTVLLLLAFVSSLRGAEHPNVLLILVDDLGWTDLRCQGNEKLHTPHIDQLARQGLRFTSAYAASPVCSPTRASILTGLAPARLRITNHIPDQKRFLPDDPKLLPAAMRNELPLEHETIAERLKTRGYRTGFFGKWHLSGKSKRGDQGAGDRRFAPEAQGFDVNVGGCSYGGPPTFFDPYRIHNLPPRKEGEYLPDRLVDETISFIDSTRARDRPFFVALWPYAVHWPMEAPERYLAKYRGKEGPGLEDHRYGAMIEAFDAALGKLFSSLEERGLSDDTLVVFTSDNGAFDGVSDLAPLKLAKGYLYEGGIRVPLIVRYPGRVLPGVVTDTPVISTDLYPTILEAVGALEPRDEKLDGVSFWPALQGETASTDRALFFHYPHYAWHRSNRLGGAVRKGRYKLIERFDDGSLELYDLEADLSETTNLAGRQPELAARLGTELATWRKEVGAAMPRSVDQDSPE